MPGYVVYSVIVVKVIKGRKDIVFDGLSWNEIEFFVCGGVCEVFLNFADVEGGVHEAYPTPFVEWFNN